MRGAIRMRGDWLLVAAILAGGSLRLYQIAGQIVADDEWHAIHLARDIKLSSIASHFGESDVSIPIALFYSIVMYTFGLSEWIMRAPVVFFGLLSLAVFPLLVRRLVDSQTAALFACLLAVSPIHVYYSRYARPYSITLFCAFCGVLAFYLWRTTGARQWKWLYGVCAVAGPYFHLSVLPVLCAPLALLAGLVLLKRTRDVSLREVLGLMAFVAAGLALLLLPPIYDDFASLAKKTRDGVFTRNEITSAAGLLLGTEWRWVQALTLGIVTIGAVFLSRKQSALTALLALSSATAVLSILVTRPTGIGYPIVLARYVLFLLPVLLLGLAAGLRTIGEWLLGHQQPAASIVGLAWVVFIVRAGPLPQIYYQPNNFTNHGAFEYYPSLDPQRNLYTQALIRPVSPFYIELAKHPAGTLKILEAPWYYEWAFNPFPFYQRIHRQRVAIGFVRSEPEPLGEAAALDPRFHFQNFVHLKDMDGICTHNIDRVVIHKDLEAELGHPVDRNFTEELPSLIAQYHLVYGRPVFEDVSLVVFNTADCKRGIEPATGLMSFAVSGLGADSWTANRTGPLNVTHGRVQPVAGHPVPEGVAIFALRQNGVLISETAVPATALIESGRTYAEVNGPVHTGIAIANANDQPASISFYFTGANGKPLRTGGTTLAAHAQIAAFLDQPPFHAPSGSRSFTFNSSVPVGAIVLRGRVNQRSEFLMTTLPVASLDAVSTRTVMLPHFAVGGGWSTRILMVNPANDTIKGRVHVRNSSGVESSAITYNISGSASVAVDVPNSGPVLQSGSLLIEPDSGNVAPVSSTVFSLVRNGVTVAENGVAQTGTGHAFHLFVEASGAFGASRSIRTGMAISNGGNKAAVVNLELFTMAGSDLGLHTSITIPANGQVAVFLHEIPAFSNLSTPFQGVLRLSTASPSGFSMIGLRGAYNERGDFLIATMPHIDEELSSNGRERVFPHIVNGGGYTTQFILMSPMATSGEVRFFSQSGSPTLP